MSRNHRRHRSRVEPAQPPPPAPALPYTAAWLVGGWPYRLRLWTPEGWARPDAPDLPPEAQRVCDALGRPWGWATLAYDGPAARPRAPVLTFPEPPG
jgi:hypothetical protein